MLRPYDEHAIRVQEGATTFVFENDMGNHGCSYMHT